MTDEHVISMGNGFIVGFGKSYFATCRCGWWGDSRMHESAAVNDGEHHQELQQQFVAAETWGAV